MAMYSINLNLTNRWQPFPLWKRLLFDILPIVGIIKISKILVTKLIFVRYIGEEVRK